MTLTIPIISTFSDKGLKRAGRSVDSFAKSATRSLAGVFGVVAIERFARSSVKAFLADDKAATLLTKTLTNLGLAFNEKSVKSYIQNLQDTTGVLDDSLRPAFASLLVATQDYKSAQDLLTTALDVSAGTGKDLRIVSQALSKAYLGNYASLSRLGAGISKADITTGNYNAMVEKLNKTFTGSALTAADTYAGQVGKLKNAFKDLQEQVGEGIIISLQDLGKDKSVSGLAKSMREFGDNTKYAIIGVGDLIEKIRGNKVTKGIFDFAASFLLAIPRALRDMGKASETAKLAKNYDPLSSLHAQLKVKKKIVTLENASLAAARAKAALDKANRALDFAGTIFDLDKIQLYAALQGKITQEDRDKLTLKLLLLNAENQTGDALNKSAAEATRLSEKILMQNGLVMTYDGMIKNLATAKNPFEGFDAYTKGVLEQIRQIQLALNNLKMPALVPFMSTPFGQVGGNTGAPTARGVPSPIPFMGTPFGQAGGNTGPINGSDMGAPFVGTPFGQAGGNGSGYIGTPFGQTTINVNAGTIANPQEIQDIVQNAIQLANRSGNSTNYAGGI